MAGLYRRLGKSKTQMMDNYQTITSQKETQAPGKAKTLLLFIATLILGFAFFVLPNVFFGVSKAGGGIIGINLLYMALFQVFTLLPLLYLSLRMLGMRWRDIGLVCREPKRDVLPGLGIGLLWTALQFLFLIPATGGAARPDVAQMLSMMDGTVLGILSYIALGVIGGGITEEIYFRGYIIGVLPRAFSNHKTGLWVGALFSILFFAIGHLPTDALGWFDILVPSIAYTLIFLRTGSLAAPIIAHGLYNTLAILLTWYMYYPG